MYRSFFRTAVCATLLGWAVLSPTFAQSVDSEQSNDDLSHANTATDPQMQRVLDVYKVIAGTPIINLTPQDARQQFSIIDAAKAIARGTGKAEVAEPVGKVTDGLVIPGPGGPLPIRIYTPEGSGPACSGDDYRRANRSAAG